MASGKDYYDILGVSKDASESEIKSAFSWTLMYNSGIPKHLIY